MRKWQPGAAHVDDTSLPVRCELAVQERYNSISVLFLRLSRRNERPGKVYLPCRLSEPLPEGFRSLWVVPFRIERDDPVRLVQNPTRRALETRTAHTGSARRDPHRAIRMNICPENHAGTLSCGTEFGDQQRSLQQYKLQRARYIPPAARPRGHTYLADTDSAAACPWAPTSAATQCIQLA